MTGTLNDVTPRKNKPDPTPEELAAVELVRRAREQGLSLTGPDGLLNSCVQDGARDRVGRGGAVALVVRWTWRIRPPKAGQTARARSVNAAASRVAGGLSSPRL
jgi:hypothetical protein